MDTTRLPTLASTQVFAERIAHDLAKLPPKEGAYLIALSGDLGAGKTTFVQMLSKILGIRETVQSPTFVLARSYTTNVLWPKRVLHIDAYRLEGADALRALAWEKEILNEETLILLEWPECVAPLVPSPDMTITFSVTDDRRREAMVYQKIPGSKAPNE